MAEDGRHSIRKKRSGASGISASRSGAVAHPCRWKLEDAKARFSEVVRRANSDGPQHVTLRGKDAVVVVSAKDFAKLQPPRPDRLALVPFLQSLNLDRVDLTRDPDHGRDVDL